MFVTYFKRVYSSKVVGVRIPNKKALEDQSLTSRILILTINSLWQNIILKIFWIGLGDPSGRYWIASATNGLP